MLPAAPAFHSPPCSQGFEKTGLGERVATIFVKIFGKSTLGLAYGLSGGLVWAGWRACWCGAYAVTPPGCQV